MRNKKNFYWSLVTCLIISFSILTGDQVYAATRNVPGAFATIQAAIDAATDGDIVRVDDGTYVENINFLGKAITVKSVNGAAVTTIDGGGVDRVVTFNNNEPPEAVLDGFTITNGKGGILCEGDDANSAVGDGPSPIITNCVITDNTVTSGSADNPVSGAGAGIQARTSSPTITHCDISNNTAKYFGGGIHTFRSIVTIDNCTINNNSGNTGGGISSAWASSLILLRSTVSNNSSIGSGGGIMCFNNNVTINECSITNNTATANGGGISIIGSSVPHIVKSVISGNSAGNSGGGIFTHKNTPTIINCTITQNSANGQPEPCSDDIICPSLDQNGLGGGIFCHISGPDLGAAKIDNCTISDNTATIGGGGLCSGTRFAPKVTNSILWGNTAGEESNQIHLWWDLAEPIDISYSDIQGGWGTLTEMSSTHNIDADPLFVGGSDYHLTSTSPCIDTANAILAPADDIEGDIRPQGAGADMGSDEFSLLGTISGFVRNTAHSPITNALVKLRQNGNTLEETFTNHKGHYEFRNLGHSGYGIQASKKTYKNNWALGFVNPTKKWRKNEFINLILTPRNTIN